MDLLLSNVNIGIHLWIVLGFPGGLDDKESTFNAGDPGSVSGLGRSPGEGNGNPLSILAWSILMDREAWQATVQRVMKS